MNSKWMGLWAQERQGFYAGQVIKKTDIPKHTRIVLRYNKFYEKDSTRPRFVYCFADSEGYEQKCVPIEEEQRPYYKDGAYYTEGGDRLFTRDECRQMIDGAHSDGYYGRVSDSWDILPEDFI